MYLWLYWENKKDKLEPPFISLCRESVYKHCSKNFEVILVTPDNLNVYLPDLRKEVNLIRRKGEDSTNNIALKTAYIRVVLLQKYGGIWLDSDMIVMQSFEPIKQFLLSYDFVGYLHNKGHVVNNFFASNAYGIIINSYMNAIDNIIDNDLILPWGLLGAKTITPLTINKPNVFLYKGNTFHPIEWYNKDLFFTKNNIDKYIDEFTMCTALFNDIFPSSFKSWSKDKILKSDLLISKIFRRALGYVK